MKRKTQLYHCIIVGAGPAGLFAAYELVNKGLKKILVIDKGKEAKKRTPNDVLHGVGGAGLFSDGKLNLTPRRLKTDLTEFLSWQEAEKLVDYIEETIFQFGPQVTSYPTNLQKAQELRRTAKKLGLNLLLVKEKHLGSDQLPIYIKGFEKFLRKKGVDFLLKTEVSKVLTQNDQFWGVELKRGKQIRGKMAILAPGREGNGWLIKEMKKLKIKTEQKGIEIGIRVEVPLEVVEEITAIIYDPPIFWRTKSYDDLVEVFCLNPAGFVVKETYKHFVCVNGHACKNKSSLNSNFALLNQVSLTKPVTDTIAYGESICRLVNTIGGGKPIIQRLADFKRKRRSNWQRLAKSYVEPTLKDVTPGDISMAFPQRIVTNLIETLERLDQIIPGVNRDSTLLYAPEVKFFSVRPQINSQLETKIRGLFVAGDGAGVSGNIIGAAATGVIAARGVLSRF